MGAFSSVQNEIYVAGLEGTRPALPTDLTRLEARAAGEAGVATCSLPAPELELTITLSGARLSELTPELLVRADREI